MLSRAACASLVLAVLLPIPAESADAEAYSAKPLRPIIAYAAGGGTDVVRRVVKISGMTADRPCAARLRARR